MSILERLNMLVRSELGARSSGRPTSGEVRATLRDASESLSDVKRVERRLDREYQNLLDAMDRAEQDAVVSLESREEERARRFLEQKAVLEREAEKVRLERDDAREQLYQLRGALQTLQDRAGLSSRSGHDSGRVAPSVASIERELDSALESPAFGRFTELEGRIADIEARAEADLELLDPLHDPRAVAIDEEFRRLDADQQLNELRESAGEESALDRLRQLMNED